MATNWSEPMTTTGKTIVSPIIDETGHAQFTYGMCKTEPSSCGGPSVRQLKRAVKLLIIIGLTIKHAVCRINIFIISYFLLTGARRSLNIVLDFYIWKTIRLAH